MSLLYCPSFKYTELNSGFVRGISLQLWVFSLILRLQKYLWFFSPSFTLSTNARNLYGESTRFQALKRWGAFEWHVRYKDDLTFFVADTIQSMFVISHLILTATLWDYYYYYYYYYHYHPCSTHEKPEDPGRRSNFLKVTHFISGRANT